MPFVQAALSVTEAIEKYGAYAGLASVVGLAVLSLLYFAQAREVKLLREWAAGAEDREADLQRRVVAQASRAAAAARPLGAQTAAGKAVRPGAPAAAPATVAAAAAVAKVAAPATGAHAVPGKPAAAPVAASAAAPAAEGQTAVAPAKPAVPAKPAAAPGAPNGQPPMARPAGLPAKPAAAPPPPETGDTGPVAPVRTTAPRPARAGAPSATLPPRTTAAAAGRRDTREAPGRSTGRLLGIGAAVVLGVAVVGFGASQLLGGDDAPAPSNTVGETVGQPAAGSNATRTTGTSTSASGATNDPSSVNVAVLNGTTVTGLAAEIAQQIEQAGYIRGTVTNSPDQSRSATIVSFREGSRADALEVAQRIGVGQDAVRPLDPSDAVTAGEEANVVVVVGADRTDLP
jgi:hypothetical protein